MDRYWRLGILALVAFLLGTATVVAAPAIKANPGVGNPKPTLFTLLDGVDVGPSGAVADSSYVNVEGFRDFKVFIQRTGPNDVGILDARLFSGFDGVTDALSRDTSPGDSLIVATSIASPADYVYDIPSEPHMFIRGSIRNNTGETQTISMFLYAVP